MSDWQWKNDVKKRDGYVCRRCGFDKNLHAHHILPKDTHPYDRDYPPNGLTLCGNCHSLLKDKEEQTDLRGFLPNDQEIDEQLKYLSENALVNKSQRVLLEGKETKNINRSVRREFRLGNKRFKHEQYEVAIFAYDKVIHLKSDFVEAYYYRGKAKHELKQYKNAIADYDDAIRLKSDFVEAYYYRGKAKYELKQYKAAIYDYDKALSLKPNYVSAYFDRGLAKYALRRYQDVIIDYDMVTLFTRNNPSAYFNRGLAKYKLGQHDTAIIDFDEAISLKPDFVKAYYYRGLAKYEQELYDAAIADFDEVNHLDPNFKEDSPYLKLAIYEKAIRQNPKDPFAYYCRGQVNAELGQHDAARINYDIAGWLSPRIFCDGLLREIFRHKKNEPIISVN